MNNFPPRRDAQRLLRVVPPPAAGATSASNAPYSPLNQERPEVALGQRVRDRRMRAGITAAELGRLAGLAQSAVLNVENGCGSRFTAHRLLALMGAGREIPASERTPPRAAQQRPAPTVSYARTGRNRAIVQISPERLDLLMESPVAYEIAAVAIAKASRRR
ncbi:helix-turn-helix domain-containing protein [Variovorax gossypii]